LLSFEKSAAADIKHRFISDCAAALFWAGDHKWQGKLQNTGAPAAVT
jgi:hypothetical protein